MRKCILASITIVMAIPMAILGQGLNSNANYIRNNFPDEYQKTIRAFAVSEWGNDHQMVVYTINEQSDSLIELVRSFDGENTQIAYEAILDWSVSGYKSHNDEIFKEIDVFGVEQLISMRCDWMMVKYVYDTQVEAKNAY